MQHRRFKTLGIVSSKKPFNTHLWWEHSTYGLILVDSGDQTKLFISTDKADNWSEIDLSDNANSYKIQAGWLDGNDLWLVMCDNDGTADDFEVCFVELDDSNDCNPITVSAGADINTVYVYDIWVYDSNVYVVMHREEGGVGKLIVWDVDTNPFVNKDSEITVDSHAPTDHISFGVTIGDNYYFLVDYEGATRLELWFYDHSLTSLGNVATVGNAGYSLPSRGQQSLAYDGSDVIYMIWNKDGDGLNYLITFSISVPAYTYNSVYNIALMLDRNNSGVAPNEFEKGFSIDASETVYEIKAKRGGIRILQDCSGITDAVIIAITDNFLMNNDGDMFEFTDVTNEISTIRYTDGIMGILKKGNFTVHPNFHINWNKGDSIKIYDQYDQLEFHGLITDKNRNSRGIYVYKIDSFTNEIYRNTYENDYSGDDSDTKQKDIIDNACDFCYRASSIVGTATNYDYEYNRAIIYLFWLTRFLERQVPYIEPDGKIWTKAHDGLAKNDMIYPGTYNFKDEADGDVPAFITTNSNGASCTSVIIAVQNGHRKVLELDDQNGAAKCDVFHAFTAQESGTIEYFHETDDITKESNFVLNSAGTQGLTIGIGASNIRYHDGAWHNIVAAANNTIYHMKVDFECGAGAYEGLAADTFYITINGTRYGPYNFRNVVTSLDNIRLNTANGDTGYKTYFDAFGFSWDPAYIIGDNEVVWNLNNHWQEVFLIDIPGLEEKIQGFFDGNSGITRNIIRYKNNATTIRPVAATRDPIEQLQGILPLNEFRDPKIEEVTEANQLGDNRYDIWSNDIIFLGLRVEGQGYLQPGKTIEIENTGEITIPKNDYLILSFERNPKNDVYNRMILSDNIIFPSEFTKLQDTSNIQIHTASVQAIENQFDINLHLTREGGLALRLTNKTGGASVKGTLVEGSAGTDNAFTTTVVDTVECFGVVYEDGIADGSECLVVIGGRCQVLLKDATASTRGNWVETSDVVGRADATSASPAAAPTHFKEIGHCIESKGADTDVLAFIMMHFL